MCESGKFMLRKFLSPSIGRLNHLPASGLRFDCGMSLYLKPALGPIQPFTQEFNQRLHRS
jgi:hypothetical protein